MPLPKTDSAEPDLSDAELERRRRLEYEEGDEEEPVIEQKVQYAQIKLAKLPMASEEQKLWHAKVSNRLRLSFPPGSRAKATIQSSSYLTFFILSQDLLHLPPTTLPMNLLPFRLKMYYAGDGTRSPPRQGSKVTHDSCDGATVLYRYK